MQFDSFQKPIADRLASLTVQLQRSEATPRWRRTVNRIISRQRTPHVSGIYIWGGVGRGKTCLMDRFFARVPITRKTRMHFHQFMQMVHKQLSEHVATVNPLEVITTKLARDIRLLCFDEFVVSDIGDAMILSELLKNMFDNDIVLVATSNIEPRELYKDGLQRSRFLPAIELLENFCEVVHLNGPVDYRLRALRQTELYRIGTKLTPEIRTQDILLLGGDSTEPAPILKINHRDCQTVFETPGVVGFMFEQLCVKPRSAPDYIEIARLYHTLFVYEVPLLDSSMEEAAKRFITLVDVLYDHRVNFVVQAATSITELYVGSRSVAEFERTTSRIVEMASENFLSQAHQA